MQLRGEMCFIAIGMQRICAYTQWFSNLKTSTVVNETLQCLSHAALKDTVLTQGSRIGRKRERSWWCYVGWRRGKGGLPWSRLNRYYKTDFQNNKKLQQQLQFPPHLPPQRPCGWLLTVPGLWPQTFLSQKSKKRHCDTNIILHCHVFRYDILHCTQSSICRLPLCFGLHVETEHISQFGRDRFYCVSYNSLLQFFKVSIQFIPNKPGL